MINPPSKAALKKLIAELVLDIFPKPQLVTFAKEEGELLVDKWLLGKLSLLNLKQKKTNIKVGLFALHLKLKISLV